MRRDAPITFDQTSPGRSLVLVGDTLVAELCILHPTTPRQFAELVDRMARDASDLEALRVSEADDNGDWPELEQLLEAGGR